MILESFHFPVISMLAACCLSVCLFQWTPKNNINFFNSNQQNEKKKIDVSTQPKNYTVLFTRCSKAGGGWWGVPGNWWKNTSLLFWMPGGTGGGLRIIPMLNGLTAVGLHAFPISLPPSSPGDNENRMAFSMTWWLMTTTTTMMMIMMMYCESIVHVVIIGSSSSPPIRHQNSQSETCRCYRHPVPMKEHRTLWRSRYRGKRWWAARIPWFQWPWSSRLPTECRYQWWMEHDRWSSGRRRIRRRAGRHHR